MAHWKEHVQDCQEQLGNGWDVVHHWLDEMAKIYWPWKGHRVHRHHREGIEVVRQKWGDEAAKAAEIHILKDEGAILSEKEMRDKYTPEVIKLATTSDENSIIVEKERASDEQD